MALPKVGVEAVVKGYDSFQSKIGKMGGAVGGFGKAAAKVAIAGVAALGAAVVGVGAISLKMAVDWESAFTGVRKTVNTTELEFKQLEGALRDLAKETPVDVNDLAAIAELGGQLGIVDETTQDVSGTLADFARTISAIGVTTNLTTEEAATGFAQLANIMSTPREEISNMASSVVALGNNFATTEADVLNFATRIAGAGAIAGLTEAQVFGIGAAMSSVGIQAEAGGTAVQKVLLGMNEAVALGGDQLEIFAAVAGDTTEDFADMWKNDAGKAFNNFVKGLGNAGDDAIVILDELGLKDQRLIRSFLSLANAGDLLGEALDTSSDAFKANTALQTEADLRYKTTASQMVILKNNLKDVAITIGQFLLPLLNKMVEYARPVINIIAGIVQGLINFREFSERLSPEELIPGFLELPEAVQGVVEKVLSAGYDFIQWLKVEIPKAAKQAAKFWEDTLYPALQALAAFIQDPVIPTIKAVVAWLSENIPAAFQAVKAFWEDPLKPTLKAIWEYIRDNVIPKIIEVYNWLYTNIPLAFQQVRAFWDSHLSPALVEIWEYLSENIIPVIMDVFNWFAENIPRAFRIVKTFWTRTLLPVLKEIWHYFQDNIIPILTDVVYFLGDTAEGVVGAFQALYDWWLENGEPLITWLEGGFGAVLKTLKDIVTWVGKVVKALDDLPSLNIPIGGVPGLPPIDDFGPPLQQFGGYWRKGGLARLHSNEAVIPLGNQAGISALARAMKQALAPMMAPAMAGAGSTNSLTMNMYPTINNEMEMVVFEERIKRIVTDAVGE